ncbi:MAG: SDR family oxidoreductase [Ectothiorhodospiraceae bacterium]|nr:SDR family oxidoreductase [Chromatiales bacterium]MCP5154980.1 SDR family oxidoreductase [Ectothiorhodospiraceae bacterium]
MPAAGGDETRRVVVTGASRGIGAAIAARLSADGWSVINLDREPPGDGDGAVRWVAQDLADARGLERTLEQILVDGPVLGLVNNAGIARAALLEETSDADFDQTLAVNLRAPMICARALVPGMRAAGHGRIVNIASRALLGKTHRTAYAATKAGIHGMTRTWALELARDGITCNSVAPGPIRTELFERANPPDMPRTREIVESVPIGRLGEPTDVAHAVAFFMDPRSTFVTGQVLYVCGGITLARGGS